MRNFIRKIFPALFPPTLEEEMEHLRKTSEKKIRELELLHSDMEHNLALYRARLQYANRKLEVSDYGLAMARGARSQLDGGDYDYLHDLKPRPAKSNVSSFPPADDASAF